MHVLYARMLCIYFMHVFDAWIPWPCSRPAGGLFGEIVRTLRIQDRVKAAIRHIPKLAQYFRVYRGGEVHGVRREFVVSLVTSASS